MRTLLLFPPGWQHLQLPYLALPCLTGFLRSQGWHTEQRDLNIGLFHYLCRPHAYADLHARGQARFQQLDRRENLSAIGQSAYADLAWMALPQGDRFHGHLLKARAVLQSDAFYDIAACWKALRVVNDLWGIVRATQVGLHLTQGSARVQYPEESSDEVFTAVEDGQASLYWRYYEDELAPALGCRPPDCVGISISDPGQLIPGLTLGRFLKHAGIRHVVIGGNVPTRLRMAWPQVPHLFTCLDSVVVYEGERPLAALLRALDDGTDLSAIPNLIYWENGRVNTNELARPVPLADVPAPEFDGISLQDYLVPEPALPVQFARGCYWGHCAFCNFDKGVSQHQAHGPAQLAQHLKTLVERHQVHLFSFVDDALRPEPTAALADEINASDLDIEWEGSARFDRRWTADRCRRIAQAGCRTLSFGLESANARVLRLMRKGIRPPGMVQVLENCAQAGIINRASLFFGFPGENLSEAKDTLDFVLGHREVIHGVDAQRYTISRCSPVAEAPDRFGVTIDRPCHKDIALRYYAYQTRGGMTRAESRDYSLMLYGQTQALYPYFALTYYPVLLYVHHHGTTAPLELVAASRPAKPQGRPATTDRSLHPRLRENVCCSHLAYDLTEIRRALNEGYEEVQPINPSGTWVIVDAGERRIFRLSPLAAFVLGACDGSTPFESIVVATAERFGLTREQAKTRCSSLLQIHSTLLALAPSFVGGNDAYRARIPA